MFDHLINENDLKSTLKDQYDITNEDLIFIKEQIVGYPIDTNNQKRSGKVSEIYTIAHTLAITKIIQL